MPLPPRARPDHGKRLMATNYRWWVANDSGGVHETSEAVDNVRVFPTFGKAAEALGDHFHALVRKYEGQRYFARNLKKRDMRDGEISI
jgi:hypothetical protein